ncbi:MAG: co-chaperone GroES [Candidatus Paceibacterota bacterium]
MAKKLSVRPLADRVIVEPLAEHERGALTKSGIFIPETAEKERAEQGVIVAIGPGKRDENGKILPMNVKVGEKVMFAKYGSEEFKIGGKEYLVLSESSISLVFEN